MRKIFGKIGQSEIRNVIAVIYILMVLGYVYVLVYHPVPAENKDLVNVLGGYIISGTGMILAYFFGSSKNEADKADKTKKTGE